MSVQTRTVYRLRIQDTASGALQPVPAGPLCAAPEIAKSAELVVTRDSEQLVLTSVLQRRGDDGCWHTADVTITEVL